MVISESMPNLIYTTVVTAVTSWILYVTVCVTSTQACPDVCTCTSTETENKTTLNVVCNSRNIPANIPNNTTYLVLNGLYIKEIPGYTFSQLQNLSSLIIASQTVTLLGEKSFCGLVSLKTLILENLDIRRIHQLAFSPLVSIKHIRLSSNRRLGLRGIAISFYGLANSSIETLDLDTINRHDYVLESSFFKYFRKTQLKKISLSDNQISIIEPGYSRYIPHLESLVASANFIVGRQESMIEIIFMRELQLLDFSYQRSKQRYVGDAEVMGSPSPLVLKNLGQNKGISRSAGNDDPCQVEIKYPFPPKLEYIYFKHFSRGPKSLDSACITTHNSLRVLDASENELTKITGVIAGLVHLEVLNIRKCQCEDLPFNQFQYLPALKELRMGYNMLGHRFRSDRDGSMFNRNPDLEVLDISHNGIHNLSDAFIQSVNQLKEFDVSANNLSVLHNFSNFTNLRVLNLSNNAIAYINTTYLKLFDSIAANTTLSLYLSHNTFTESTRCCDIEDFIIWTTKTKVKVRDLNMCTCISKQGNVVTLTSFTRKSLNQMCAAPFERNYRITVAIAVATVLFILIVLATIGYRTRWRARWILLASRRFLRLRDDATDTRMYDFDAFVSFNVEDIKWVKDYLIVELEEIRGLRLCIHHRDFTPGVPIEENIVDAIERSRKTILLLTSNFVKSNWCHFEVHMARNKLIEKGYDIIVPIILEPFDLRQTSRTLRNILDRNTYLEWHESGPGNVYFWKNLSEVLSRSSRNVILEE